MLLNSFDTETDPPDYDTLKNIILDYREFAGAKAAFHVEYPWWPGSFETRDEEMEFFLNEHARPDNYEVLDRWHDEAVHELAASDVALIDTRFSRNVWRATAIVFLIPYALLWYLWRSSS